MRDNRNSLLYKLSDNIDKVKKEYKIDIYSFLDAIALGLRDEEISDLLGYDLDKVKKVRQELGNIGSEIGINYKKNLPT